MSYHQIIYNRLRQHGITEAGALGVLGNFECESNCEPYRLQGDFSSYRTASKAFVAACTNGSKSRADFCNGRVGFGIAQWTSADRQAGLWDFWKASGKTLDDAEMQTDFVWKELQSYSGLLSFLKTTTDVFTACSRVCREFERPAVNNIDARYSAANRIKYEIDLNAWESGAVTEVTQVTEVTSSETEVTSSIDHSLNLRTIDKNCSGFAEVFLLQSVLLCRGYMETKPDGSFGSYLLEIVKQFQNGSGLTADGVVGPLSWAKLLER